MASLSVTFSDLEGHFAVCNDSVVYNTAHIIYDMFTRE